MRRIVMALSFAIAAVLVSAVCSHAQQPAAGLGAGERVVLRCDESLLRKDGRDLLRSRRENHFYRVEAVKGDSVTVKAEGDCIVGVARSSEVIPISRGIDQFTATIEVKPTDPFAYLMRAALARQARARHRLGRRRRSCPARTQGHSRLQRGARSGSAGASMTRPSRIPMRRSAWSRARPATLTCEGKRGQQRRSMIERSLTTVRPSDSSRVLPPHIPVAAGHSRPESNMRRRWRTITRRSGSSRNQPPRSMVEAIRTVR